ncbi:hypothetical protein PTKIN_Ptkin13bG0229200 [Pterospermum kingtungense]
MPSTCRIRVGYIWFGNGEFIAGQSVSLVGLHEVKECEALALLEALRWVQGLVMEKVIFETDSRIVVDAVTSKKEDLTEFGSIIDQCRSILSFHNTFMVKFVRRRANVVAHSMAQQSRYHASLRSYYQLHIFLHTSMNNVCSAVLH